MCIQLQTLDKQATGSRQHLVSYGSVKFSVVVVQNSEYVRKAPPPIAIFITTKILSHYTSHRSSSALADAHHYSGHQLSSGHINCQLYAKKKLLLRECQPVSFPLYHHCKRPSPVEFGVSRWYHIDPATDSVAEKSSCNSHRDQLVLSLSFEVIL